MANDIRLRFLEELTARVGPLRKLPNSQSLFETEDGRLRLYLRYSKPHERGQTFFGIREVDLRQLQGANSFIAFLWDGQRDVLFLPFDEYEAAFASSTVASDGQYKVQIHPDALQGSELYLARVGRFNIEGHYGWKQFEERLHIRNIEIPELSHSAVQSMLGAIGVAKGFNVWLPLNNRGKTENTGVAPFPLADFSPLGYETIEGIISEIDVVWMERGSNKLQALYEVEHSTPIYSGLLRFNDIHLLTPSTRPTYGIVSNYIRRGLFARQINRPTFKASGLDDVCTFLEYRDVYYWYDRVVPRAH